MATKTESVVVNASGLVQGIVLVTFPAASTIFTEKSQYGLSSTQYGNLFLPQVATAIVASLLGAGLARRITTKRVYLLGLACSTVSMGLLIASTAVKTDESVAYPLLLVATAFLGAGFGLTVPVLNTYAAVFHPDSVDRSCSSSTPCSGWVRRWHRCSWPSSLVWDSGGVFPSSRRRCWWCCCCSVPAAVAGRGARQRRGTPGQAGLPTRFWFFAAFAVLYGICETMNGNWSQLDMTTGWAPRPRKLRSRWRPSGGWSPSASTFRGDQPAPAGAGRLPHSAIRPGDHVCPHRRVARP